VTGRTVKIAYVTQIFPFLTETFVYREVLGLRRRGLRVDTFAVRRPDPRTLSRESRALVDETVYVFPVSWARFVANHLHYLFSRPLRYLGTLLLLLTRRGESPRNRVLTLFHFCMGVHLARTMQRREISHVHAHFAINAATIALTVSRLLDVSFSFTAHNLIFTNRLVLKEKMREARFVVAISEFTRRFLIDLHPDEDVAAKIHVVHCGLPVGGFSPPSGGTVNEIPVIMFVAQLAERKGVPVLVEACKLLVERGERFRCLIVGDGPVREPVERLIAQQGLEEIVEMRGAILQEQLIEHLGRAEVFVLPCVRARDGDMDGIPVSLMESMAMGIATVSTRISGIPELIEDGRSGLLVEPGDAAGLADALQRLIADPELRRRLGEQGRCRVETDFGIDRTAAEIARLFERYAAD